MSECVGGYYGEYIGRYLPEANTRYKFLAEFAIYTDVCDIPTVRYMPYGIRIYIISQPTCGKWYKVARSAYLYQCGT